MRERGGEEEKLYACIRFLSRNRSISRKEKRELMSEGKEKGNHLQENPGFRELQVSIPRGFILRVSISFGVEKCREVCRLNECRVS